MMLVENAIVEIAGPGHHLNWKAVDELVTVGLGQLPLEELLDGQ